MNDEQLWERRRNFLTSRLAGGTYSSIAQSYNQRALEAAMAAGRDPADVETVSATTVRSDCARAKQEMIDDATRDALRGEHRAVLQDMRRANYKAMAGGDVDAAKVVMSTLVREAEMFGLDDPKRSVVGVGTNVEFASDLVALIEGIGYQAPSDLVFAARGERTDALAIDRVAPGDTAIIDGEIVPDSPFDMTSPEPSTRAAAGVATSTTPERAHGGDRSNDNGRAAEGATSPGPPITAAPDADDWSNI